MKTSLKTNTAGWLIILLSLLLCKGGSSTLVDQHQHTCDTALMKSYRLSGLKHASNNPMQICPGVQTKCCTLVDELTIYRLWHGWAKNNNKRFIDMISLSWSRLLEYHEQMKKLDRDDITVHYMSWRWVPYVSRMCGQKFLTSPESKSNPAPMELTLSIDSELPGVGPIKKFLWAYKPDYLDVISKQVHMKHVIEIYKAVLNQIYTDFSGRLGKSRNKTLKMQKKLQQLRLRKYVCEVILAYKKRKKHANKLHIFSPKSHLLFVKAFIGLGIVNAQIFIEEKLFSKTGFLFGLINKKMKLVQEMLAQESTLMSLYNMSQIADYKKLKKFIYKFVLKYRHNHKPFKKLYWTNFKPSLFRVNMKGLRRCPRWVIVLRRKEMEKVRRKKYYKNLRNQPRNRKRVFSRRKNVLVRWKKKQIININRQNKKYQMLINKKKKKKNPIGFFFSNLFKKKKAKGPIDPDDVEDKISKDPTNNGRNGNGRNGNGRNRNGRNNNQHGMNTQFDAFGNPIRRRIKKKKRKKPFTINNYADNLEANEAKALKIKKLTAIEKQVYKQMYGYCNWECQQNRLPKNVDFNYMCLLPKNMIIPPIFKYYPPNNCLKKGQRRRKRRKRRSRWSRTFQRRVRQPRRGPRLPRQRRCKPQGRGRGRRKRKRRRGIRGFFGRRLKDNKKEDVVDSTPGKDNSAKGQKSPQNKKKEFKMHAKAKMLPVPERQLLQIKPSKHKKKSHSDIGFNIKTLNILTKMYNSPVVKKKSFHKERMNILKKNLDKGLTSTEKLENSVDKLNSVPIVESKQADQRRVSTVSIKTHKINELQKNPKKKKKKKRKLFGVFKAIGKAFKDAGEAVVKVLPVYNRSSILSNPRGKFHVKRPPKSKIFTPKGDSNSQRRNINPLLNARLKLTSFDPAFFYKTLKNPLELMGSFIPRDEKITCKTFQRHIWKSFVNVNKEKLRYCYRVYDSLQSFDTEKFKETLAIMRGTLFDMLQIKRSFYCALCDVEKQKLFNHADKRIIYSGKFCVDILGKFRSIIYFQNVIMIEYMDQLLQLIQCYRANGNVFNFPFHTYLERHKRRVFFIQRCFRSSNDVETKLKNCMFMCNQYEYVKISKFFDGDLRTLRIVLMQIFQYLREMRFSPYIKSPPFGYVTEAKFPAVVDTKIEKSKKYRNDQNTFAAKQEFAGMVSRDPNPVGKDNTEETLKKKIIKLQYTMMYKNKHEDHSVEFFPFNKKLKKNLKMVQLMATAPLDFIPKKIKSTLDKRKRKKAFKKSMKRLFNRRMNRQYNTRRDTDREKRIIKSVTKQFNKAKKETKKLKKEMTKLKIDPDQEESSGKKRDLRDVNSESLDLTSDLNNDKQLKEMQESADSNLLELVKNLKNDKDYYGLSSKPNNDLADAQKAIKNMPERILAKKQFLILSKKVFDKKTKKYKHEKVKWRVRKWSRQMRKMKKWKINEKRFDYLQRRMDSEFGNYPSDSEHIMHGIYERRDIPLSIKNYKPLFITLFLGLNPVVESEMMDIDLNPENLLKREFKRRHPESFSKLAILQYFGVPNKTIKLFNTEMNLGFRDLAHVKEMKSIVNNPKPPKKHVNPGKGYQGNMKKLTAHTNMIVRHHLLPKRHTDPKDGDFGIEEADKKTSADKESQLMFYLFDHRSKYPIFKNN